MAIQSAPLQGEDCDEAPHAAVATVSGMGNSQLRERDRVRVLQTSLKTSFPRKIVLGLVLQRPLPQSTRAQTVLSTGFLQYGRAFSWTLIGRRWRPGRASSLVGQAARLSHYSPEARRLTVGNSALRPHIGFRIPVHAAYCEAGPGKPCVLRDSSL